MGAGRPRKTRAEKEAKGTLQTCREPDTPLSFEPLVGLLDVPEHLEGEAANFFVYYSRVLISRSVLTAADIMELEIASMLYGEMRWHHEKIKEDHGIQTTQSKYTQKTASWQILVDTQKGLREFSSRYGLNLVSRERIDMPPASGDDDLTNLKNS